MRMNKRNLARTGTARTARTAARVAAHTAMRITAAVATAALALSLAAVLAGCTNGEGGTKPTPAPNAGIAPTTPALEAQAQELLATLTLEQKVAQLFIITPEALTGYNAVTAAGRVSKEAFRQSPVGGLIYFAKNLETPDQTREMLDGMQGISQEVLGLPIFLCVDEEGGDVARVAGNPAFGVDNVGDAWTLGAAGETAVTDAAAYIARYLADLGFTMNFAPVADIVADPQTSALDMRSFGATPDTVSSMVSAQVEAYLAGGILPCVKHFPGIGAAVGDSHVGAIAIESSLADMETHELVPFRAALAAGAPCVMVGHVGIPRLVGSTMPASMSAIVIDGVLRGELGFDGLIVTDALNMGAVRNLYDDRRIGVEVLLAGADLILMPADFPAAYEGILDAVKAGELTEARIDESVLRIILAKLKTAL